MAVLLGPRVVHSSGIGPLVGPFPNDVYILARDGEPVNIPRSAHFFRLVSTAAYVAGMMALTTVT